MSGSSPHRTLRECQPPSFSSATPKPTETSRGGSAATPRLNSPRGIEQASALGLRLKGQEFDAAYSSDLSRAHRTAILALEHHHRPLVPVLDPGLREMHYGEWESLIGREIGAKDPDLLREFFRCKVPAPGGESIQQVRERTAGALRRTVAAHPDETLLVVSHGNAIMAMIAELLAVPYESTWSFAVANTSITRLTFSKSGRMTLTGFNDHAHIESLVGEPALVG